MNYKIDKILKAILEQNLSPSEKQLNELYYELDKIDNMLREPRQKNDSEEKKIIEELQRRKKLILKAINKNDTFKKATIASLYKSTSDIILDFVENHKNAMTLSTIFDFLEKSKFDDNFDKFIISDLDYLTELEIFTKALSRVKRVYASELKQEAQAQRERKREYKEHKARVKQKARTFTLKQGAINLALRRINKY